MATLVLSSVGSALGGPLGGALGGLVGGSIDGMLSGSGRKGPRLGDLSVQTSSYGSSIPRIYGSMRAAGTVVWATDLQESEALESGGKGSPERLAYHYSASFAVALSSRPIREVRRIWADGKLIRGAAGDFKIRTGFRLRLGDEDQAVDPLIGSVEGIDLAPAYRGLALAIFEDMDLGEFGNRIPVLTFETVADEALSLGAMLADASGAVIASEDDRPLTGFAAHGASVRDALEEMVDLFGLALAERGGRLSTSKAVTPWVIAEEDLGCSADGKVKSATERVRTPESALPASLTMSFYDRDRDYQAGLVRTSAGKGGLREQQIELPAVLLAPEAKALAEAALARRWAPGGAVKVSLPPSAMGVCPGDRLLLPGRTDALQILSVEIERLAVTVEAAAIPDALASLPADGGRASLPADVPVGRTSLALFEVPAEPTSGLPPAVVLATSCAGSWRTVTVDVSLDGQPLPSAALTQRAMLGWAQSVLAGPPATEIDEFSVVEVRLVDSARPLLNADDQALAAGVNFAMLGNEMIQFGRAEEVEPGLFRLSHLLRGRRGTGWAAGQHGAGEAFCLVTPRELLELDLPSDAVGRTVRAVARGVGDEAPLPEVQRMIVGPVAA